MTLKERLIAIAKVWEGANGRSLARLATIVVNDGSFFSRLESGAGFNVGSFEKFLVFFRDKTNWRDDTLPAAAVALLADLDAIATETTASPDIGGENIEAAAA